VHPDDARYKHLIGKLVTIPLVNRDIPIIGDPLLVDPTLGTGAVKVTPAHDPNDYASGQRNRLPMINILNPEGTINANGGAYAGLDRAIARERVVEDMEKLGLFEGREDRDIELKHSDRSKSPIEPYLSDQWFVLMGDRDGKPGLAQQAMDAVSSSKVQFFPARYGKTYLDWLGEKRDWCISRQLWWGHRIPIWYVRCPEAELKRAFAGRDDVTWRLDEENGQWLVCALEDLPANALGEKYPLTQDADVLDTWFSSQLWPHSTLGWPEQTPELKYWYPTSVLVTSRDIITLWVARMVIAGQFNTGQVPFHHVYIHPKILDGFGETMSKSKGNGIDPLDIIDRYGTDALRYIMVHMATETQDSRMPVSNVCPHCDAKKCGKEKCDALVPMKPEHMYMRTRKVTCPCCKTAFRPGGPWPDPDPELPTAKLGSKLFDMGRNFANKLWNAARFLLLNLEGYTPAAVRVEELPIEDRWILSRLATTTAAVTEALEGYHFSEAARAIYDFTWSEFCDWYVEMSKGRLRGEGKALAQRVLAGVLDGILRLVHPIMPFVAESIWHVLNEAAFERGLPSPEPATESVVIAAWPHYSESWRDAAMEGRIAHMQELVRAVREVRNRYPNIPPATKLDAFVRCPEAVAADFRLLAPFIAPLAGVGALSCGPDVRKPPQSSTSVSPEFETYVSLRGLIDVQAEIKRLEKQLAQKQQHLTGAQAKLNNPNFSDKAPPDVVQAQKDLVADYQTQLRVIEENLRDLKQGE
jgi:valyl-tRNA synthetase